MKSRLLIITLVIACIAATIYATQQHSSSVLDASITQPQVTAPVSYAEDVRPVLEQRCVVCHACYDAPCQLKLGSFEGITRGANKDRVYDGERLIEANLTRLFEDGHTTEQWRDKDFFPVIAEQAASEIENQKNSVMAKMLLLKEMHPLPQQTLLPEEFELDLNREYQCPTIEEFADYESDNPKWGMPYGLPAIEKDQHNLLIGWIAQGAKGQKTFTVSQQTQAKIDEWEAFLNQDTKKAQLMSRYLYEHLFLNHLHFADSETKQFFKLVRSATQPGQAVQGIFTRRPFDDPKVERVYYRIQPVLESIAHKSHLPTALNSERMQRWKSWFLEADFDVTTLPSYKPKEASNPFVTFAQIPLKSRYRYMLDESQNTIMQFIKGPVCRGQMALNVINDHFWVVFASPELDFIENNDQFMQQARQKIALPAEEESTALPTAWLKYAALEKEYLQAKSKFIEQHVKDKVDVTLDLLWDGDGENDNASLTIFRHNDAATVVKGLVGDKPQTAWVLTYPLFERIHYLLVAGYDVYGNLGHQLNSRMYMDFLRMEGEFNFLNLLPKAVRKQTRQQWYRGSVSEVEEFVYGANRVTIETDVSYQTDAPLTELYTKLQSHLAEVSSQEHQLNSGFEDQQVLAALEKINQVVGINASLLPQSSIVRISDNKGQQVHFYTLLRHNAYTNISHLFDEEDRRLPAEDTITIAPGLMTSHPNAFFSVTLQQVADFATELEQLKSEQDYQAFRQQYAVYRTSENFWSFADAMHKYYAQRYPVEFGVLDFNRLENR